MLQYLTASLSTGDQHTLTVSWPAAGREHWAVDPSKTIWHTHTQNWPTKKILNRQEIFIWITCFLNLSFYLFYFFTNQPINKLNNSIQTCTYPLWLSAPHQPRHSSAWCTSHTANKPQQYSHNTWLKWLVTLYNKALFTLRIGHTHTKYTPYIVGCTAGVDQRRHTPDRRYGSGQDLAEESRQRWSYRITVLRA